MPAVTKKRPLMEPEAGESKAHEAGESPEEETREGSEPEEAPRGSRTNRKRSAKNANNTKAPMDGESCGCGGGKGKAKKCTCDGGCGGGYAKKMDRNDALTPQEYLAACDLGIQGRSRSYIRARLDAEERLDLKCGNGSISQGETCHKGGVQKVGVVHNNGRPLSDKQVRQIERGIVAHEIRTGKKVKMSKEQAALLISTPGTQSRKFVAASLRSAKSKDLKAGLQAVQTSKDPMHKAVSRVARRELFNRRVRTGVRILGAGLAIGAATAAAARNHRGDSIFANGFSPELDQLTI